jgi:predicted ATPase
LGLLTEAGRPVRLGSRAIQLLTALVERAGETVSKRDLMLRVWPDTHVVEANLSVHIAALRRALGEGGAGRRYIANVPGRGYRFIAEVVAGAIGDSSSTFSNTPHNLPAQLTRLIGREAESADIERMLRDGQRLATIVGAGGVGKTALALQVAESLLTQYADGVWLVDLVGVSDGDLVAPSIATALSMDAQMADPLMALGARLHDRTLLIVVDNCEHVIDAVAVVASSLLKGARGLQVLATSREPLRVEGERVFRLAPLASPPDGMSLSARDALTYPAVQLFAERAASAVNEFDLSDAEADDAAAICRELDGLPLAIELAAPRLAAFGVRGMASRLDDRLRLLSLSQRAVWPRHKNIIAALDWSYELLSLDHRRVFRRLAVFVGGFTLHAATHVAASGIAVADDILADLVEKSLVTTETVRGDIRFKFLETTRDFARAKLVDAGEARELSRAHAEYFRDVVIDGQQSLGADFTAALAAELGNIRAALRWCLEMDGDKEIGVALLMACTPLFFGLGLLTECHGWSKRALSAMPASFRGTRRELDLMIAVSASLAFSQGLTQDTYDTWERTVDLSERLGVPGVQLLPLRALWTCQIRMPYIDKADKSARRYAQVAREVGDPEAMVTADWMLGTQLHHAGDVRGAIGHFEAYLASEQPEWRQVFLGSSGYDRHSASLTIRGNALWIAGYPDQALASCNQAVADARATNYALAINEALMYSAYTKWFAGVSPEAIEAEAAEMRTSGLKHALAAHHVIGVALTGMIAAERGEFGVAQAMIRQALDGLEAANYRPFLPLLVSELAGVLASSGRLKEALDALNQFAAVNVNPESWCMPEFHRRRGELLLADSDLDASETALNAAAELAGRQHALSWTLRIALTMLQLREAQGRRAEGVKGVQNVYERFTEGFGTADLKRAGAVLRG